MKPEDGPARMGRGFTGIVEEAGSEVRAAVERPARSPVAMAHTWSWRPSAPSPPTPRPWAPSGRAGHQPGRPTQYEEALIGSAGLFRHGIRLAGGPSPVRTCIEQLMPDIPDGTIEPGKVFGVATGLDGVPAGAAIHPASRTNVPFMGAAG